MNHLEKGFVNVSFPLVFAVQCGKAGLLDHAIDFERMEEKGVRFIEIPPIVAAARACSIAWAVMLCYNGLRDENHAEMASNNCQVVTSHMICKMNESENL